jgi:hypothetical protein
MENLDQESKSQSQPEIFIFSEPRFPTGRNCLEEGKFTASYFFMAIFFSLTNHTTECSFRLKVHHRLYIFKK